MFYGRTSELLYLRQIWDRAKSDLLFIRGRRRVGKSELLRKLTESEALTGGHAFLFAGRVDESDRRCRERFARDFDSFTGQTKLHIVRSDALTWDVIFTEVFHFAKSPGESGKALLVVLDEIQWLAKKQSGILGAIKEYWEKFHSKVVIKVILAGSSNRFFKTEVDHPEGVLRGLRTKGDLWLKPFSLGEVQTYFFPSWTYQQVALTYMLLGGIPYYLEQIEQGSPFLRSLNDALFTAQAIFIDEIDAILKVESSGEGALANVKTVLASLGQDGRTLAKIGEIAGFGETTVRSIVGRLESFGLVRPRESMGHRKNRSGLRYFMDDFFLNTYFNLILPLDARIRANRTGGMLLNEWLTSNSSYYIPNFSGRAFELLVFSILEAGSTDTSRRKAKIFEILQLGDAPFTVGTSWIPLQTQIDIVVSCPADRTVRILETKWKGSSPTSKEGPQMISSVLNKAYTLKDDSWSRRNFLVISPTVSPAILESSKSQKVVTIALEDLFDKVT